jgi:hypothetical protein
MGGLLSWVFHSPRRLLAVVATPIVMVAVVAGVLSSNNPDKTAAGTALPESVRTQAPSQAPETPYTVTATPEAPAPDALRTTRVFVETWLAGRTTEPLAEWHKALAQYATPQLAEGLRRTDPERLPDTSVSGTPEPVSVGEYLAKFIVPLADGSSVAVTTAWDGQAWRITDIQPGGSE